MMGTFALLPAEWPLWRSATVIVAATIALYLVVGWVSDVASRRRQQQLDRLYTDLVDVIFGSEAAAARAVDRLASMRRHLLLDTMQRVLCHLTGEPDDRIRRLALATGMTRPVRRRIRSRSWRRRAQGASLAALLAKDDPLRTVSLFDPHPTVRARCAESLEGEDAVAHADRLIELLDDPVPAVRFAAQQALLGASSRIVPPLLEYLLSGEGDGVVWALEIAANLPDPRLVPGIERHLRSADALCRARATEAMIPWLSDASELVPLLDDVDAGVRATAARAVGLVPAPAAAAHVGRLLSDPSWEVRQAAGAALCSIGPAGLMTLRCHLRDPDPYARDMARLMLGTVGIEPPKLVSAHIAS